LVIRNKTHPLHNAPAGLNCRRAAYLRAACLLSVGYPLAVHCLRSCAFCVRFRAPCRAPCSFAVCAVFPFRCFHQPPTGALGVAAKSGLSLSVFPPFFRRSCVVRLFLSRAKGLKISVGGVAVRTPAVGGRRERRKRQRRRLAFVSSSDAVGVAAAGAVRGAGRSGARAPPLRGSAAGAAGRCCGRRGALPLLPGAAAAGAAVSGRRRCCHWSPPLLPALPGAVAAWLGCRRRRSPPLPCASVGAAGLGRCCRRALPRVAPCPAAAAAVAGRRRRLFIYAPMGYSGRVLSCRFLCRFRLCRFCLFCRCLSRG